MCTKILPIPTFIDDYNHYMGGVDQSNQLRAAFTTHFPRNQKEFFPGAFWAIDIAVYNSYKLHLAINGSKTSKTGKRDPQQHRKWIEDLVDLLFQIDNDDFGQEITSKPYPKYQYQSGIRGRKSTTKEAFLDAINGFNSEHLYTQNPLGKKGWCFFCLKRTPKTPLKEQESSTFLNRKVFQLNHSDLIEIQKKENPKRIQERGKQTKGWCQECQKFICKDCWSLYHK